MQYQASLAQPSHPFNARLGQGQLVLACCMLPLPSRAMPCRLTFPYITWTILQETFGRTASEIVAKYLIEFKPGYYRFRPEVDT